MYGFPGLPQVTHSGNDEKQAGYIRALWFEQAQPDTHQTLGRMMWLPFLGRPHGRQRPSLISGSSVSPRIQFLRDAGACRACRNFRMSRRQKLHVDGRKKMGFGKPIDETLIFR